MPYKTYVARKGRIEKMHTINDDMSKTEIEDALKGVRRITNHGGPRIVRIYAGWAGVTFLAMNRGEWAVGHGVHSFDIADDGTAMVTWCYGHYYHDVADALDELTGACVWDESLDVGF